MQDGVVLHVQDRRNRPPGKKKARPVGRAFLVFGLIRGLLLNDVGRLLSLGAILDFTGHFLTLVE